MMSLTTPASSECQGCGAHVTDGFARVFGDNNDIVQSCPQCDTATNILAGATVGMEVRR